MEVRLQRADVYHVTGDVHFLTLALPPRRTLLTIHDLGFLGRGRRKWQRWLLKKLWLDWPVAHSRLVTAVSESTRLAILEATECPAEKVVVIPTVIPSAFRPAPRPFNADCPTLLHIGLAPNKNFFRHVDALAGLNCKLKIIGRLNAQHLAHLEKHGIDFHAMHDLSQAEMQQAYEESDIVLFASTLEGFGMPIVEGNTVERVVVTSSVSSMPEVAGDAACLVNPLDTVAIRAGIERVIQDREYRDQLIANGRRNRLRFTAESVASQYRKIYECLTSNKLP